MAVADERRERCDGCGRTVVLESLTAVTMPDGERLACCPSCEPHARNAAERLASLDTNRADCDGCNDRFPTATLEEAVLSDGTVVTVCPDCLREVPGYNDGKADTSVGRTAEGAASTEIARRTDLCSQCHEWFEAELYRVTTIDGRTEAMCHECMETLDREGVIADVKMRKAEAREILDVDAGASDREIRVAFLTQIKNAHPDRKTGTTEAFKLVKEAYDRLT